MKALINPNQPILEGYYVVEVATVDFPVASPMFWNDCEETVVAYEYYFEPVSGQILQIPVPVVEEVIPTEPTV